MARNKFNMNNSSSVVSSSEEAIYNSAKEWTEFIISEIKKAKKLGGMCINGAETLEEINNLSDEQLRKNRINSLKLYLHQIKEVINIGEEGIHKEYKKKYLEVKNKFSQIRSLLPEDFYINPNKHKILTEEFFILLYASEELLNQSIHIMNQSGLIYKFIRERDPKKEAFKKEQKFLTV